MTDAGETRRLSPTIEDHVRGMTKMQQNTIFDLTIWHKLGIYVGLFMVSVGGLMYIPTYVNHKLQVEKHAREQGSPVWLEMDNLKKRKRYVDECRSMPRMEGDIKDITCLSEAASLFPNRNWKEVAAKNVKEGA